MQKPANDSLRCISVALIGNPNTGKTTLFNRLTGLRHHVGNYAGVTVETKSGTANTKHGILEIIDLPGTYSLAPRSPDEMLAVDLLLGHRKESARPDCICAIVDGSNLERNLYLTTQAMELGVPVILAVNMVDLAESKGIRIDLAELSRRLGIPVVGIQAHVGKGIDELTSEIFKIEKDSQQRSLVQFPEAFHQGIESLRQACAKINSKVVPSEYLLSRALIDVGGASELSLVESLGKSITDTLGEVRSRLKEAGFAVPALEPKTRYRWIGERLEGVLTKPIRRKVTFSDWLDRILIHRVFGLVIFILLMAGVFQSIFWFAPLLMNPIDAFFGQLSALVKEVLPAGSFRDLLADGVIAGVGSVLVFLPQIVILFGFIAILEDCGYMARAAFLMDRIMAFSGLSGRSFIPLLSSFACAIPGIMATRTVSDPKERFATIVIAPLMSCSARLPLYFLLLTAFIPEQYFWGWLSLRLLVLVSMYLLGLVLAPLVSVVLRQTVLKSKSAPFLMELPVYKVPSISTIAMRMWDAGLSFVTRAGTLILPTAVIIWALQYYPRPTSIEEKYAPVLAALEEDADNWSIDDPSSVVREIALTERKRDAEFQEQSYLGILGKKIEPAVKPIGWDWRIAMAAIASFPAREVVVSALGTIFSVGGDVDENAQSLQTALKQAKWPDTGKPLFTVPVALSLMVFFSLCCQCSSTLVIMAKETRSWRWPIFTFVYMTALAYAAAFIVYQVGTRLAG